MIQMFLEETIMETKTMANVIAFLILAMTGLWQPTKRYDDQEGLRLLRWHRCPA